MGVEFPGETYTEPGTPNWVGHLVTKYAVHHGMVAYCYAVGGARVDGVEHQIKNYFEHDIGQKPEWARWDAADTLFGKEEHCLVWSSCYFSNLRLYDCSDLGGN
jgi:hypothetical protein